ncbi:DUF6660 family protein [Dyadobacter psychrotolerans]|uniref:Uncharacterized protein n=1 Tax=Dyadobacter psychrotolerans TaxID=2541721 RepID=A0A4R5DG91_9BACT|nr:DUF6660 family protein [Dyadobacter psychrotolerans]TDE09413.1 hypothetical protein E0F88_30815 [Dyadobacter psychrotolerans]
MTRIILIVLAIYTAALSCIPCKDQVSPAWYSSTVKMVKAETERQKPIDVDLCTPFCTCSCCAGVSLQQEIAYLPDKSSFSTFGDIAFAYLSRTHIGDLTSIWQPPRA